MLNFRVTGLSALLAWLRAARIVAGTRAEGNPIELQEPPEGG
jgi:hypothetical protein